MVYLLPVSLLFPAHLSFFPAISGIVQLTQLEDDLSSLLDASGLIRADCHHVRTAVTPVLHSDFVLSVPHRDSDGQRPLSPAADNQDLHP